MKRILLSAICFLIFAVVLIVPASATVITVPSPNVTIDDSTQFYYVTFLVDGRNEKILSVPQNGTIPEKYLPDNPKKDGYIFKGWTFKENDPAAVADFSTFEVTSDTFFYSYWDNDYEIRQDDEVYHSDIYWTYPRYMTQNLYLVTYNYNTFSSTVNIINEYIETPDFIASAIEHGIDTALSPSETGKFILDKMGVSNFQYNKELDKANEIFVKEVFNVSLENVDSLDSKYLKKFNEYLKLAQTIDKALIEEEANNNKTKPELYKYFSDLMFDFLIDKCKNLEPEFPSFESVLYTALNESTELLGLAVDAADFAKGIGIAILMQDVQLEMVQDIIDTQPSNSTLYQGMTRLKKHLRTGAVSYFLDTNIYNKIVDEVVGYLPEKLMDIAGTKGKVITLVVKALNSIVFDLLWDVDYYDYATSCVLQEYADDFYISLNSHAACFDGNFTYSDIEKFRTMFDAYIAITKASLNQCKKIAKFNETYNEVYATSAINNFCKANIYDDFVAQTKKYLRVYTDEVLAEFLPSSKYDVVIPEGATYTFSLPTDNMEENHIYARYGYINSISANKGSTALLERDCSINKLTLYGTLSSNNASAMNCNLFNVTGDSEVTVPVTSKILNHSSGTFNMYADLVVTGDAVISGIFNQSKGSFSLSGDLSGGTTAVTINHLYLNSKLGQTIARPITVSALINNGTKGFTADSTITVIGHISSLNPIINGKNIVLTETARFADDTFVGSVTVSGLTGELPSLIDGELYMTGGNISQTKDFKCNFFQMTGGTLSFENADVTVTGPFDFGKATVNLVNSKFAINGVQKANTSGGTINIDADSKYSNLTDVVLLGTVTGDGTYYIQGDLTNNGAIDVSNLEVSARLPVSVSGNSINVERLTINAPKGFTVNNKIYVADNWTFTGKVINSENIIADGGITITEDKTYNAPLTITGDLIIDGKTLVVNSSLTVKGNIAVNNGGKLIVNGLVRLTGTSSNTISIDETSEIDFKKIAIVSTYSSITNNGILRFGGDVSISSATLTGSGTMYLRGDLYSSSLTINHLGALKLNGLLPQKLSCSSSPTFDNIIISNPSRGGVTFNNTFYYYETYEKGENAVSGTVSHKEA